MSAKLGVVDKSGDIIYRGEEEDCLLFLSRLGMKQLFDGNWVGMRFRGMVYLDLDGWCAVAWQI